MTTADHDIKKGGGILSSERKLTPKAVVTFVARMEEARSPEKRKNERKGRVRVKERKRAGIGTHARHQDQERRRGGLWTLIRS